MRKLLSTTSRITTILQAVWHNWENEDDYEG